MTCPTPAKSRNATVSAAQSAARRSRLGVGKDLYPYECPCGWHHLTSKKPTEAAPAPADVASVHQLDDDAFRRLVLRDAQYQAPLVYARALRDPSMLHRWITALKDLQRDLAAELNEAPNDDPWRTQAEQLRAALGQRREEAAHVVRETGACIPVPRKDSSVRRLREAAGELAVNRLIAAHRSQFTELLAEEYERLGIDLPNRIAQHLAQHRGETEASA